MRRIGAGATGSGSTASSGSSSNGRSNRSLIFGEFGEFVLTVTQSFDVRRAARSLVGLDDDGVEPRIAARDLESLRQTGEKPVERRLDFDADDRIVRSRHPDVGQIGRPLWK